MRILRQLAPAPLAKPMRRVAVDALRGVDEPQRRPPLCPGYAQAKIKPGGAGRVDNAAEAARKDHLRLPLMSLVISNIDT